jgi:hydroxymethylbilane synthase
MLRIGTRDSELALWQAQHIQELLESRLNVRAELVRIKTQGDLDQENPLAALEGKGFFTKELEDALLSDRADIAVHSLKDLPTTLPPGLKVGAILSRADRREALLVRKESLSERRPLSIKHGGVLGTSSARRRAQVKILAPDLQIADLRGNVPTRVRKLREGRYDAILLAWAGLSRLNLNLSDLHVELIPLDVILPAPGQGALAIEIRDGDAETARIVEQLDEVLTHRLVDAERGLLHLFAGGCKLPLGVCAEGDKELRLSAVYAAEEKGGSWVAFRANASGQTPEEVSQSAFTDLLAQKQDWAERTKPLAGKTVAVTRPAGEVNGLREAVERMGGRLLPVPTLAFEAAGDQTLINQVLARLDEFDWLIFTSANAAYYFLEEQMQGREKKDALRIAAIGDATAKAILNAGYRVDFTGHAHSGSEFADQFLVIAGARARAMWPCAETAREELPQRLIAAGVEIQPLIVYRSTVPPAEARVRIDAEKLDWILVTSPAAGRNLIDLYGAPKDARWAAIGPTTQMEMQKVLKMPVTVAREASLEALAEVLV